MDAENELDDAFEVIEKLMEPCEKCGSRESVGRLMLPPDCDLAICKTCHDDRDNSLVDWFAKELEEAVAESGEYEKMADGKWRRK